MGKKSAKSKAKSKAQDVTEGPRKKPGNECHFKGERRAFLESHLPTYLARSKNTDGSAKFAGASPMFPQLMTDWWNRWPWRLPLDVEPLPGIDYALAPQTAAEEEQKTAATRVASVETLPEQNQKIRQWFQRQRDRLGLVKNPINRMLEELMPEPDDDEDDDSTRKPLFVQWYMKQLGYSKRCKDEFERLHPGVGHREGLNLRVQVARNLLDQEPEEVRAGLAERYELQYQKKDDVKDAEGGLVAAGKTVRQDGDDEGEEEEEKEAEEAPSFILLLTEEEKAAARKHFSSVADPLVERLRKITGYEIVILAGRLEGQGRTRRESTVHTMYVQGGEDYKKHPGLDFESFSEKHHSAIINSFSKYAYSCHTTNKALKDGTLAPMDAATASSSSTTENTAKTSAKPAAILPGPNATAAPPPPVLNATAAPPPPPPVLNATAAPPPPAVLNATAAPPPPPPTQVAAPWVVATMHCTLPWQGGTFK
ncbi:hypothetical protein FB45DRAFT_872379 [Roridomyces roridus]|uniref:Uncharacterized protein n=1 Tax=Roridomyces roridus TaxID=1738132 RepID=A0AAD7BDB5_9AGAR|nr:hypothetical protein FB45DRAFT_872379 [Roridomyces roridus]